MEDNWVSYFIIGIPAKFKKFIVGKAGLQF
jgi:hypothetical protein